MKKKTKGKLGILFLIITLILITGSSLAVFIYQANKKGVFSTTAIDTRFTSNYLKLYANADQSGGGVSDRFTKYENQTLIFSRDGDTVSFEFTVQNYLIQSNPNSQTIKYNLTIELEETAETTRASYKLEDLTVGGAGQAIFTADSLKWSSSSSYQLDGGYPSLHRFRLTIPTDALDKTKILVLAQPDSDSLDATSGQMLARVFSPCSDAGVKEFQCTHSFVDQLISVQQTGGSNRSCYPYELDAFNYQVSINTGKAWITLTWDTRYVTIDPSFKDRVTLQDTSNPYQTDGDNKSIVFQMDTTEATSCLVQFYRKTPKSTSDTWQATWDGSGMETVIQSTGVEIID